MTREMGISHNDFFRIFPAVANRQSFEGVKGAVRLVDGVRCLTVELAPESHRRLGMLRIPVTVLRFTFEGYTSREVEGFMERFDWHFHRGGG